MVGSLKTNIDVHQLVQIVWNFGIGEERFEQRFCRGSRLQSALHVWREETRQVIVALLIGAEVGGGGVLFLPVERIQEHGLIFRAAEAGVAALAVENNI